ncbi:MAG: phosphatase, partial [Candidatus Rokuibacteriota bacterium]
MLLTAVVLLAPAHALAADPTHVPSANPKSPGVVAPNVLSPELAEVIQAQGAMLLENPVSPAKYYGYNDDKP